ncbi:MAG: TonB-dependent receptor plug domain-containing protein, partial [Muribaculaceae bacterium]|nr:TonB-dependent receptor plug domain-containing protein [Muribaculaceae bacterium]
MKIPKVITAFLAVSTSFSVCAEEEVTDTVGVMLDEVNVTNVKQMSRLKNETEAATIIGRIELEQLGVSAIKGITGVVPNFYIPDYGSRMTSSIYVRGIGARMDQPSVGLNVDNVPYMNKDAYDFDVADIASVEMLRGPQSTLYGRNTMAGVINVTTLSPMRFQGWRISLEAASGTSIKASGGWYHKFNSNTGLSFVGAYGSRK